MALVSFGTDVTVHNLRNGGSVESADYERDIDDIFVPAGKVSGDLELKAGGLTSLNQALLTACELEGKYANRVKEKTLKAPYKTVVVLLTDGHDEPGGDVSAAADRISNLVESGKVLFLPFGYGDYSEDEFAELCEFLQNVGIERVGVFEYSPEEARRPQSCRPDRRRDQAEPPSDRRRAAVRCARRLQYLPPR